MINRNIRISIFVIFFDIMTFILFVNIKYFLTFIGKYLIVDLIVGCTFIISVLINTITLILVKRKIKIIFNFDLFLIHTIFFWVMFITVMIKYGMYSFRLFPVPIIVSLIYIIFSIIFMKGKKKIERQNDT